MLAPRYAVCVFVSTVTPMALTPLPLAPEAIIRNDGSEDVAVPAPQAAPGDTVTVSGTSG